ncbi:MAG: amidohydrolase [Candidatus Hydrogenedentes bacterium]|nr:amidohydrolase [Candidatus Hydrogenedentota bacterium]
MPFLSQKRLDAEIGALIPEITALRHTLHRHPDIRYEEHWTSDCIAGYLAQAGIHVRRGYAGGTGLVGEIGPDDGPIIALRADMDGLELQEITGLTYASEIPGHMHACGHDGHMAMLCGAAVVLARHAEKLRCRVRFIFQPGEEMGAGGALMVKEGVLDGVAAVFGMHGWPEFPEGTIALKPGYAMAGADWFSITVQGKGCHAAAPDSGIDPIVAAAHVVLSLQSIVSRELNPCEPAVVSVGRLSAGTATNIIPDRAELCGTIRTLSPEMQEKARAAVTRIAHGTAAAYGAKASVSFDSNSYAPLYNDPDMCAYAKQAVQAALGNHAFREVDSPSMAAEDFAFYLRRVAGAFLWLGIRRPGGDPPPLHSPRFDFNDAVLPAGIQVWISLAGAFPKTD